MATCGFLPICLKGNNFMAMKQFFDLYVDNGTIWWPFFGGTSSVKFVK